MPSARLRFSGRGHAPDHPQHHAEGGAREAMPIKQAGAEVEAERAVGGAMITRPRM